MSEQKIEEFWRDATADDVARVMRGETFEARFRDGGDSRWKLGLLSGWTHQFPNWSCGIDSDEEDGEFFEFCQVYDPPEWFVNKPEPGEGWRLLEKFPHEAKLGTDEALADRKSVV